MNKIKKDNDNDNIEDETSSKNNKKQSNITYDFNGKPL